MADDRKVMTVRVDRPNWRAAKTLTTGLETSEQKLLALLINTGAEALGVDIRIEDALSEVKLRAYLSEQEDGSAVAEQPQTSECCPEPVRFRERHPDGRSHHVAIRLTADEVKRLDRHVRASRTTRSSFVRRRVLEGVGQ